MSKKAEIERLKDFAKSLNICLARRKVSKRARARARYWLRVIDEDMREVRGS